MIVTVVTAKEAMVAETEREQTTSEGSRGRQGKPLPPQKTTAHNKPTRLAKPRQRLRPAMAGAVTVSTAAAATATPMFLPTEGIPKYLAKLASKPRTTSTKGRPGILASQVLFLRHVSCHIVDPCRVEGSMAVVADDEN